MVCLPCLISASGTSLILAFSAEELYIVHTAGGTYTTWTPCAEQHRNATMAHHPSLMSSIVFFSPAKQMGFTFRFKWDKQDDYKILYCAVIIFIFYTWLQIRSLVPVLAVEGKFKKRSFKHFISHNSGVRLFKSTTTKPPYAVRKQHAFPWLSESYCIILYLHRCGNRQ